MPRKKGELGAVAKGPKCEELEDVMGVVNRRALEVAVKHPAILALNAILGPCSLVLTTPLFIRTLCWPVRLELSQRRECPFLLGLQICTRSLSIALVFSAEL